VSEHIKAIHDAEVIEWFRKIGRLEDLYDGNLRCYVSKIVITEANFRAAKVFNGEIIFCCNTEKCYLEFLEV
jgi:hypothetical protein